VPWAEDDWYAERRRLEHRMQPCRVEPTADECQIGERVKIAEPEPDTVETENGS